MRLLLFIGVLMTPVFAMEGMEDAVNMLRNTIGAIAAKYADPVPPKGIPLKDINGPKCKDSKIGIVGAGPSGTHMAWLLKQAGYTNVTILEKSDRIGGKSINYQHRGIPQFVTTVIALPNYERTVIPLLDRFNLNNFAKSRISGALTNDKDAPYLGNLETIIFGVMQRTGIQDPMLATAAFFDALDRYIGMHKNIFGDYEGSFPNRPDEETSRYLQGTFGEFFERNNLTALFPFFYKFYSNYGYGYDDNVAAYYPLAGGTPELLLGLLTRGTKYIVAEGGFQRLFELMIETENIPVIYRTDVDFVRKNKDGSLRVYANKGDDTFDFDYLIWSGNLNEFGKSQSNIITDYKEKELFRSVQTYFIASNIINMKNDARRAPTVLYLQNEGPNQNNKVYADFDATPYALNVTDEQYVSRNYEVENGPETRTVTFFQQNLTPDEPDPSINELRNISRTFYENLMATDIEFLFTETWDNYFPHWPIDATNRNAPWDLYDLQGRDNIMFIGGGPGTGEYLKAVLEYNVLMMEKMSPPQQCGGQPDQNQYRYRG